MKYIKLEIQGNEIEFNFGLAFLGELLESTGLTIEQIIEGLQKNPFKIVPQIMFESVKHAKARRGKVLEMTVYDMADLIDESGGINQKAVEDFLSAFYQSLTKDVPKEDSPEKDEVKKK